MRKKIKPIGPLAKKIVEDSNLQVEEVAVHLGISRASLYTWYKNEDWSFKNLVRFCEKMKVQLNIFWEDAPELPVSVAEEDASSFYTLKAELSGCRKEVELLNERIKDKDELIKALQR